MQSTVQFAAHIGVNMQVNAKDKLLRYFYDLAIEGDGRARPVGGGNTLIEITILKSDIAETPEHAAYAGGTARITLNRNNKLVGYKFQKARR